MSETKRIPSGVRVIPCGKHEVYNLVPETGGPFGCIWRRVCDSEGDALDAATLYAAAPDLLAACKMAASGCGCIATMDGGDPCGSPGCLSCALQAAITKAEGVTR